MRRAGLLVFLVCMVPGLGQAQGRDDGAVRQDRQHRRLREISFDARLDFPTGLNLRSLVTGDFDRDGNLDVAAVADATQGFQFNGPPDVVVVFLGDGKGKFERAPDVSLGSGGAHVAIAAADFDRDGRLDLAVLGQRSRAVTILSGRQSGRFETTRSIPVGENPVALVSGDFNGDKRADLAVLNQPFASPLEPPGTAAPGNITLLTGQQAGGFESVTVPAGLRPTAMAASDFNRDGHTDLAVMSLSGVTLLLDGRSQPLPDVSTRGSLIAAGDINGDRWPDLAVVDSGLPTRLSVLFGTGNGTFRSGQTQAVAADPPLSAPLGFATAVVIGEFTGDREPDVAVTIGTNSVATLLVGAGDGMLQPGPAYGVAQFPVAVASGEFNGDRRLDLAIVSRSGELSILAGVRGGFKVAPAYPVGCCPASLATGDFDEDGRVDLVVANFVDRTVTTLIGGRRGRFESAETSAVQNNPSQVATADFDRDGHLDLAMSHEGVGGGGNTVSIALGRGDGTFQTGQVIAVGSVPSAIVSADFNHDAIPDLAVANDFSFNVSILIGVGNGTFVPNGTVGVGRNPLDMAVADTNGDGDVDLVVANTNQNNAGQPGSISVLLGRGDGTFTALPPVIVGVRPISVTTADFNGDHITDLAVLNQFGRPSLSVLVGNGDGTFSPAPDVSVSGDLAVVAGDFDDDGHMDLAVSSTENGVPLLLGNGDGTFVSGPVFGTGNGTRSLVAADFNRDGLLDLASGDYDARTVSILINTSEPIRGGDR